MMNTTEKENKIVLKPWMLYFWTLLACSLFLLNTYCEDYREKEEKKLDRELDERRMQMDRELDERRMQMDRERLNIERSKMTPEELKRLQTIEENMRK